MTDFRLDTELIRCLFINSNDRSQKEIQTIASFLRGLHCFSRLAEQPLRVIARCARYESHKASAVLYRKNQISTCWYLLLGGSVFIGGNMYLPPYSFGKRTGNSNRRANDCHVLLASEMIVIDYPDVQNVPMTTLDFCSTSGQIQQQQHSNDNQKRRAVTSMNLDHVTLPPAATASSSTSAQSSTVYQYSTSKHAKSPVIAAHSRFAFHGEKMRDVETVNVQQRFSYDNINSSVTSPLYRRCPPLSDIQERCGSSQSSSSSTQAPPQNGRHNSNGSSCGGSSPSAAVGSTATKFFHRPSFRRHSSTNSAASTDRFSTSTTHSRTATECDDELADLPEVNVDTDEEDDESCPSGDSFMELRDNVRECLERDPSERNEDDILVLLDFMQHMPAFANLPVRIKRELCLKMVFAVVEKANTTIMRDGEQMDSWSVLVNGEIEVLPPDGSKLDYRLGDSFGVEPRPEVQYQCGEMRTLVDDCQFVLVAQADYVETMSKASDNLRKQTDAAGEIISETEKRVLDNNREGYVLIKGKSEKLIQALIEDRDTNIDQYYVEDFLLMYRTFIENPVDIFEKFLTWFNDEPHLREKVARLVLLWVNNHFNDFETEPRMTYLLEQFEQSLEQENMINHQQLLNIACSVKSRARVVVYTRSNRDEMLHFSILGGSATLSDPSSSHGIFISNVENNSQAQKNGLKRGDQILEVNNVSFLSISLKKALEILRGASLLSITVKANVLGFKEMISGDNDDNSGGDNKLLLQSRRLLAPLSPDPMCSSESSSNVYLVPRTKSYGAQGGAVLKIPAPSVPKQLHHAHSYVDGRQMPGLATFVNRGSVPRSPVAKQLGSAEPNGKEASSTGSRLSKLIKKIKHGTSSSSLPLDEGKVDGCHSSAVNFNPAVTSTMANQLSVGTSQILEQTPLLPRPLKHSRSNPDISKQLLPSNNNNNNQISKYYQTPRPACPEHVLKIYRTDQTYKYLSVYKDTTVQSVILMALQEFGIIPSIVDDATQQPCSSKVPSSGDWSLYEVIVNPDNIKRRRLPDHMHNLAERMTLNSRYYLTKNTSCEPLVPDHLAPELLKESQTTLIELNANILAAQLTLQDFSIFASIEPTEYVDNLFQNKNSKYGWPKLENFEHLVNTEMWWTATEVCREKNLIRRAKIIKKLIKVARQCRDFKNFNSMFAIVSGLEKPCVRRLHATWDKVPSKSLKMLEDLQLLLDPSRNMSKYRQHLIQTSCEPPVIPLFPVIRKDLYFIHECNATFCDGLINFEKLRMIAKEIRNVTKLASSPYELSAMCEQSGGGGSSRINDALLYMNSFEGGAAIATMRKQFMQRGPLSRKKVYEQALMVRRVKSYLSNLNVIENENELDKMSLECEAQPLSSLGTANSSQNRRRQPSPSPSSASSASRTSSEANKRNLQPKFGVESPQAVQRMLALVDHSKTKNAHHLGSHGRPSSPPILTSPNIFRRPRGGLSGVHYHQNGPFMAGGSQMIAPPLPPPAASSFTSSYLGHGRSQSESTRQTLNNYQNVTVPPPNYYAYHHQTTAPAALHPVDLTAESSSVNILVSPLRLHSSGSVTSTDSGLTNHSNAGSQSSSNLCTNILLQHQNSAGISHAISCDSTDSGHCSIDAASNLLANHHLHHHHASAISASTSSPPNQRRSYPLNPHSKILMASGVSEDKKQNLVSYPSQDSTRSSGIVDMSGQYFAECHQQTIRRTNSIPNSSTGVNTDHSNGGHSQEMGEQISRV